MICNNPESQSVLEDYFNKLVEFINSKKYGSITFIIQNGNLVGFDVTEKVRSYEAKKQESHTV